MNVWIIALIGATLMTMFACIKDVRALLWIACGVASFAFTTSWQLAQLPYYPAVCGLVDAFQCLLIYHVGKYRWEMLLWRVWQASLLLSIVRFFGWLGGSESLYISGLEAFNWMALAVIASSRIAGTLDDLVRNWYGLGDYLRRALLSLREERPHPPWHARWTW